MPRNDNEQGDGSVGYFANAQYDVFFCLCEEVKRRSKLPGGWRSTEYILRTFSVGLPRHFVPRNDNEQGDGSVGYFAYARYNVKIKGDNRLIEKPRRKAPRH